MTDLNAIARKRCERLLELARGKWRSGDEKLAKRYVQLARKIAMRHRISLGRQEYCRKCGVPFVAGSTLKTRISSGKRLNTCTRCNTTLVFPLKRNS
ncbi:MAG: hypothetical protein V1834_01265 [Candidatus Micrarchaeota archaeon]